MFTTTTVHENLYNKNLNAEKAKKRGKTVFE